MVYARAILVVRHQLHRELLDLLAVEPLLRERHESPVNPGTDHIPGLEVDIAGAALHRRLEDLDHRAHRE